MTGFWGLGTGNNSLQPQRGDIFIAAGVNLRLKVKTRKAPQKNHNRASHFLARRDWSLVTGNWEPVTGNRQPEASNQQLSTSHRVKILLIHHFHLPLVLMLESLITSKTRVKMLLKFFTNSTATAYLRELAEEFDESTNSIRHELNNLSRSGYLTFKEEGRTILYQANTAHPLYAELKSLVHKHLGIDKIIENVVRKLGNLESAYIIGDYAKGKDSGTIELLLVGKIDEAYLHQLVGKAKTLLNRELSVQVLAGDAFESRKAAFESALLIWGKK